MDVDIPKAICERFEEVLSADPFDMEIKSHSYRDSFNLDLSQIPAAALEELANTLEADPKMLRGQKTLIRDIRMWNKARTADGVKSAKARNVKQAVSLFTEYIRRLPNRRIFEREQDAEEGVVFAYFVEKISYTPPCRQRDSYHPPSMNMDVCYEKFGYTMKKHFSIGEEVVGLTGHEMLIEWGFVPETDELNADMEAFNVRYEELYDKIGRQMWAVGVGDPNDVDGNKDDAYSWRTDGKILLGKDGGRSRVLIDIFEETEERGRRNREHSPSFYFWKGKFRPDEDDGLTLDDEENIDENNLRPKEFEIPVHPYVIVFDLKRHKRLKVHVGNLSDYVYDKSIKQKLVLPEKTTTLIDTLLAEKRTGFTDIIVGKSGGVIVICQGPPGTGKTLSAEVYAEFLERGLYTVQCAQLGMTPDKLEASLMRCLSRGDRWGAVTLLDEADVYLQARGTDLVQNAVVGVFLRVLEYFSGVLFLTTNRLDAIDDAILSRCTARIQYGVPNKDEQKRIWTILADQNGLDIPKEQLARIVHKFPMAGREIKNVLKLCMMVAGNDAEKITVELVDTIKDFRPTGLASAAEDGVVISFPVSCSGSCVAQAEESAVDF